MQWQQLLRAVALVPLHILLVLACLLANPSANWATPTDQETEMPPAQVIPNFGLDASTIPSEKLSQFVYACLQVVALIERREGELQATETESESLRLQRDIEAEAIAIIEQAGLTRQEYLLLLSLANVDPEFGERVATLLQEASS